MNGDYVKLSTSENSSATPSEEVESQDLKTSTFLFTKINEVKQFCEGLFEDGRFNQRIGRFNMTVSSIVIRDLCFIDLIVLLF